MLRTTFLLLDAVAPENLDNYGELIRGFSTQYGQAVWSIRGAKCLCDFIAGVYLLAAVAVLELVRYQAVVSEWDFLL